VLKDGLYWYEQWMIFTLFSSVDYGLISQTVLSFLTQAFEDGPDRGFRNVGQYKSDAGDTPKN
jgi:hypothetical protein